jgi:hypothetical protein
MESTEDLLMIGSALARCAPLRACCMQGTRALCLARQFGITIERDEAVGQEEITACYSDGGGSRLLTLFGAPNGVYARLLIAHAVGHAALGHRGLRLCGLIETDDPDEAAASVVGLMGMVATPVMRSVYGGLCVLAKAAELQACSPELMALRVCLAERSGEIPSHDRETLPFRTAVAYAEVARWTHDERRRLTMLH